VKVSVESSFIGLRVEGGLLPADFLTRMSRLEASHQAPQDYGMPPGRTIRDEIGRFWTIAQALWREYNTQRQRDDVMQSRVGIERYLVSLLTDVFGYQDLVPVDGRMTIGNRSFLVTHKSGQTPFLLTTFKHLLDKPDRVFGENNGRRSPHATIQEFLNADDASLWGIVSNGLIIRLVRDNPSLTRPAFIEADLDRIFSEDLYADFTALWLLLHKSRLIPRSENASDLIIEGWRGEGVKTGQRALDNLRGGVTDALRRLGTGFLEHKDNDRLRSLLRTGDLTKDQFHQQLLRLVYRFLLLLTAEDRNLLQLYTASQEQRDVYSNGYSLGRIRDRARFKRHYDQHHDLWTSLTITFRCLAKGSEPLGLSALGGLFSADLCPDLDQCQITNARLLEAVHALAYFSSEGTLNRINYRDMGTEELGSVYESLLELHPVIKVDAQPWSFGFVGDNDQGDGRGSARKLTGSYYTPDSLVQELLRSALDPVIEKAIQNNPSDPKGALLRLKIIDPACGSGHFLLGAARRLADAVARLDSDSELPDESYRRTALREVVRRCIYGVDLNPLSVELCKTALWIEAIEPGKPLSFLDAHIKCGNSLVGVFDLKALKDGIPDEAFKDLTGDDAAYCRDLKRRNAGERKNPVMGLFPSIRIPETLADAVSALTEDAEDNLDAIESKAQRLKALQMSSESQLFRTACDMWCAAFFIPKAQRPERLGRDLTPTTDTIWRYLGAPDSLQDDQALAVQEASEQARFFHWCIEFPDVFARDGFDCVLGNPPWERIKLQEQEFFASRHDAIANAPNAAARRRLISDLAKGDANDRALLAAFEQSKREAEATSQFVRGTDRFALTAVGDVNLYALFAEHFLKLLGPDGQSGIIVPTGIATDDSTKAFFSFLVKGGHLIRFIDFRNDKRIFPAVAGLMRFCLLTISKCGSDLPARFSCLLLDINKINDPDANYTLTPEDVRLLNPNTGTAPVFRSSADAELTKKIYSRVTVLIDENKGKDGNPWGVKFGTLFHMSNDSGLFSTLRQLEDQGAQRSGPNWVMPDGREMVPLYEAKMIYHYDHRFGSYPEGMVDDTRALPRPTLEQKQNPNWIATPRYWVESSEVNQRLRNQNWKYEWLMGWRDITNTNNERTVISGVFPKSAVGNKLPLFFPVQSPQLITGFISSLTSMVLDFAARQKIGGTTLNYFYMKQFPVLLPSVYTSEVLAQITPRAIELTFTAHDMRPWAKDLGYEGSPFVWNEDRRAHLKAELDAIFARLYGLSRDELRYILDPADIYGPDYPSETFRVLKEKDIREYGEYRTAKLVLQAWDRFSADGTFAGIGL
jgi:hypothetical protein